MGGVNMKAFVTAVIAATALQLVSTAQERPNFSGTWTMDRARSETTRAAHLAIPETGPVEVVISQGVDQLSLTRTREGKQDTVRYSLSKVELPVPVGTSGTYDGVGIARWEDDNVLVTTTPHVINGMGVTVHERRSLSADGREMIVQTSLNVEHGYTGETGKSAQSPVAKDVYVKSVP
jgi:hypothetical protein